MFDALFPSHWSDIQKLMWLKILNGGSAVWDTITGNPVSFSAKAAPLRQLSVAFSPVQDLHGYDSPWPAGGGVNKLPPMVDGTYEGNGVKAVVKDGIATLSGTTTATGNAIIIPLSAPYTVKGDEYYHLLNSEVNGSLVPAIENANNVSENIALSASPANRIASVPSRSEGWTLTRVRFYLISGVTISGTYAPMFCADSTARSFAPYSNECPISGWSSLTVEQRGKNLLKPFATKTVRDVTLTLNADGSYDASGTATGGAANFDFDTLHLKAGSYVLSGLPRVGGFNTTFRWFLVINGAQSQKYALENTITLTEDSDVTITLQFFKDYKTDGDSFHPMLRLADASSDFVPYNGRSISISLGQTVYSGTLDVVTGVLTVDYVKKSNIAFTGFFEGYNPYKQFYFTDGTLTRTDVDASKMASNLLVYDPILNSAPLFSYGAARGVDSVMICILPFDTTAEANTWASENGLECMFKLATPLTFQLTPQEVQSLLGDNVLFSDANGDLTVEYRSN